MGGVCSKKPAVKHDVDGTADDTAPNLPHISPLPAVPEGKAAATGVAATGARPRATATRRTSLVNDFRICGNPSGMVNPFWYRLDMMDANAT